MISVFYFRILIVVALIATATLIASSAKASPREYWYQAVWCQGLGGQVEFKLNDGRRVDCLTSEYAIEVEFARKWPEAIGQSLDYSMLTGKKAGIVLILQQASDHIYWQRLQTLKNHYQLPVTLWKLGP